MELLFIAALIGCADAGTECETVAEFDLAATSAEQCADHLLMTPDAMQVDFPVVMATCRPADPGPLAALGN